MTATLAKAGEINCTLSEQTPPNGGIIYSPGFNLYVIVLDIQCGRLFMYIHEQLVKLILRESSLITPGVLDSVVKYQMFI